MFRLALYSVQLKKVLVGWGSVMNQDEPSPLEGYFNGNKGQLKRNQLWRMVILGTGCQQSGYQWPGERMAGGGKPLNFTSLGTILSLIHCNLTKPKWLKKGTRQ